MICIQKNDRKQNADCWPSVMWWQNQSRPLGAMFQNAQCPFGNAIVKKPKHSEMILEVPLHALSLVKSVSKSVESKLYVCWQLYWQAAMERMSEPVGNTTLAAILEVI